MKIIAAAGLALVALLFRGRPQTRTPWSQTGLPTPVATSDELARLATSLAAQMRTSAGASGGQVKEFQRRAGLVAIRDSSDIATASGVYDAQTRQALGYYGRMWREETP